MTRNKVLSLAVIGLSIVTLFFYIYISLFTAMPIADDSNVILKIDKDTSAKSLITQLKNKNLIQHEQLLLIYIKTLGISKRLKAGIYEVTPHDSVIDLLHKIVNFDVLQEPFRIPAGKTILYISAKLEQAQYLEYTITNWLEACQDTESLLAICALEPTQDSRDALSELCVTRLNNISEPKDLEGLFLADTYKYDAGSSARNFLVTAHMNLRKNLFKFWQQRQTGLPYNSPYEMLIAASILEKEAADKSERRLISGVIVNRLRKNMPLQMDPTVIYGLGDKYTGSLTHADLKDLSTYNTYKYKGLPPTPIATVSIDALAAASDPLLSDYLYFVAKGDGTHVFSKSYAEQRQAINKYIRKQNVN